METKVDPRLPSTFYVIFIEILAITTFLAVIAQTQYFNMEMPKVSYIKAIDIWNFVCIAFVFLATIEYRQGVPCFVPFLFRLVP